MTTNLELIKNYKTLKDYWVDKSYPKYIAYRMSYYMKKEKCNDRGFEFYDDIIKRKEEVVEISKEKYLELEGYLSIHPHYSLGKSFPHLIVDSHEDYYYKVEKKMETKKVLFSIFVKEYYDEKIMLPAKYIKKLEQIKNEMEQGRIDFIEKNKDMFTEKALSMVLDDIDDSIETVTNYLSFFENLKNNKEHKSYRNKLNRFKTAYKKLLKEKYKYSKEYFNQLQDEMIKQFDLQNDVNLKNILEEDYILSKTKEIKLFTDEMNELLKEEFKYEKQYFKFLKKQLRLKYNLQKEDIPSYLR